MDRGGWVKRIGGFDTWLDQRFFRDGDRSSFC